MMSEKDTKVKPSSSGGIAQITNVALCYEGLDYAMNRKANLPGIVCMFAPSGFGKSIAAGYVATKTYAYYVQATSVCTKKTFLQMILREMGLPTTGNASDLLNAVASELARSKKPLIIDEFDHLATDTKIELVRDIYEASQGTIMIIGEEQLPKKLERYERFHGRVLKWVAAEPASLADTQKLCSIYAPHVRIDDQVLSELVGSVRGSTRRVCTNLEQLHEMAIEQGVRNVDMSAFKQLMKHGFVTGASPTARNF